MRRSLLRLSIFTALSALLLGCSTGFRFLEDLEIPDPFGGAAVSFVPSAARASTTLESGYFVNYSISTTSERPVETATGGYYVLLNVEGQITEGVRQ